MKKILGILILVALVPTLSHAVTNTITGSMRVWAPLSLSVIQNMVFPTVFTTRAGDITSIQTKDAGVPATGSVNGNDAVLAITGDGTQGITVTTDATMLLKHTVTSSNTLTANLSPATAYPTALVAGAATATIRGTITSHASMISGSYTNAANLTTVTVVYI